jgi:hypothetical protein
MAAAKTFFTDKDQYTGFSSDQAKAIEPSLAWNDSPVAATNTVSIRGVSSKTVVLVTRSESGTTFCLADNVSGGISGSSYGRIDAQTAAECQGGWEMNFGSP